MFVLATIFIGGGLLLLAVVVWQAWREGYYTHLPKIYLASALIALAMAVLFAREAGGQIGTYYDLFTLGAILIAGGAGTMGGLFFLTVNWHGRGTVQPPNLGR